MPQFTATVEANYASELRIERDRTDADIAREYRFTGVTSEGMAKTVRKDRRDATLTRNNWIREAAARALAKVCMDAQDAGHALDDAPIEIAVHDLRATATLTLPE